MKKFTNVSGAKVGQEPIPVKISNEELEVNEFKNSIMKLMDDFLSIRSFGVARPEIMIPTRIVGKEMFVEALTDLLSQKSNKDIVKALESLKSTNRDWKSIEEKIESISLEDSNIKEEKKINDILEKWGADEETLKIFLESHTKKIDFKEAYEKYELVESMMRKSSNKLLKLISESYIDKYKSGSHFINKEDFKRFLNEKNLQSIYDEESKLYKLFFKDKIEICGYYNPKFSVLEYEPDSELSKVAKEFNWSK